MKNTKLLTVLSTFSKTEMKHIGQMTESPFFNKKKEVVDLFQWLNQFYPKFNSDDLDRRAVFAKLFPNKPYNEGTVKELTRILLRLCEDYLRSRSEFSSYTDDLVLSFEYSERGLLSLAKEICSKGLTKLEKETLRGSYYHYIHGQYVKELTYLEQRLNTGNDLKIHREGFMEDVALDKLTAFVMDACEFHQVLYNTRSVYGRDFNEELMAGLVLSQRDHIHLLPWEAQLRYQVFILTHKDDQESFEHLRKAFFSRLNELSPFSHVNYCVNLENYCKRRIYEGKDEYMNELYSLYRQEEEHELVRRHDNGLVDYRRFIDILSTMCEAGQMGDAEQFLKRYRDEIPKAGSRSIIAYANALVAFHNGDLKEASEHLVETDFTTYYQKLEIRMLELRLFYEMAKYELVESRIDSTRHFINDTNYLPQDRREVYLNFVNVLAELLKAVTDPNKRDPIAIAVTIGRNQRLIYRKWLTRKCGEL